MGKILNFQIVTITSFSILGLPLLFLLVELGVKSPTFARTLSIKPSSKPDLNPSLQTPEKASASPLGQPLIRPTSGKITQGFIRQPSRFHPGLDIAGPIGTPIVAAATGKVVFAGMGKHYKKEWGNALLVVLGHPDGSETLYAHHNRIHVRTEQPIEQGQMIAEMGSTGYSSGPHLHFELWIDDRAVDPEPWMN